MTQLVWDEVGERFYQTGIDCGVLYLHDGTVSPWNGLSKIEESSDVEIKSYYLDGVKYLQALIPGDFSGKLTAFTYPDEFDSVNGIGNASPGLDYYDQPSKSFDMSYKTRIGNDIDGTDLGYKIHILYNVIANPDTVSFETLKGSEIQPIEFSWTLTGTPPQMVKGYRPTIHISIDSRDTPPDILKTLEDILYGTDTSNPSLPPLHDISEIFGYVGALVIIDHGDGTWSAIDQEDTYITMVDDTTFQIDNADSTYLDSVTYTISSTNVS
jgi:hypothetical protein